MRPVTFTFYSYKGGVGRTLLAANMALALARQGKTLLWDLDAEAPGMHRIGALRDTGEVKAGFFNWLVAWQETKNRVPDVAACSHFIQLVRETPYTNLAILPAHGDQADSLALYYQVNWNALLVEDPTLARDVLNKLLDHLGEQGYRHVVIDSRTGLSDLGGLLAGALPDATVLVGGYAAQNLNGLAQISRSLASNNEQQRSLRGRDAAVQLFHVASPIPQDNAMLVAAGREIWAKEFGLEMAAVQEIRFDPELPFSEALLITRPEKRIAQDYERLAQELIAFAETVWQAQQDQQNEILARPDIFAADETDDAPDASLLDAPFAASFDSSFESSFESAFESSFDSSFDSPPGSPRNPRLGPHSGQRPAPTFAEQMAQLLRLLGYSVTFSSKATRPHGGEATDLIARIESGLDSTTYLVQCKPANIPKSTLEALRTKLEQPEARAMQARGMVLGRSFAPPALTYAKDHGIQALTPDDLTRRLLDVAPLLNKIITHFEQTTLARTYVRQSATRGSYSPSRSSAKSRQEDRENEKSIDDLLAHGLDWASGTGKRLWVLLGDYGTGKTAFSQKLDYELAKLARQDSQNPVPLRINLREFPNKVTLEELLAEAWQRATGQRKDPAVLLYLIERGRLILLLDSFDEMGLATAGRSVVEQFRSLVRLAGSAGQNKLANRVLLTCREQFFKDHGEATSTMAGRHADMEAQSALQGLALGFDGSIDTVATFTPQQIAEFLQKRLGEDDGQAALAFLQRQNLMQLGDRPQLLDIIIQSLPQLKEQEHRSGRRLSTGALYQIYTDQWLEEFKPVERQSNSHQLRQILEMLAQVLWQRVGNRIHYGDLYALMKDRKDLRGTLDPNQLDVELRTAAFLSRTPDGFYGFSHRSFLEYFLARRIEHASCHCGEMGQQTELIAVLDVPRLSLEVCGFVADLAAPQGGQNEAGGGGQGSGQISVQLSLRNSVRAILSPPDAAGVGAPANSRVNALLLAYRLARQESEQASREDATPTPEQKSGKQPAPTSAQLHKEQPEPWLPPGAWLAGVDLRELDFSGLIAPAADFSGANLRAITLDDALLSGANLQHASLQRASLQRVDLRQARLQGANLNACNALGARLQGANAAGASWINARLEQAELADSDFSGADLRNANLALAQGLPNLAAALLGAARARGAKGWGQQHRLLRLPRWQQLAALPLPGHVGDVTGLAFAPDGQRLASTGEGGEILLWDNACGKPLASIGQAQTAWRCVDYSHNGHQLAAGGAQGYLQLWQLWQLWNVQHGHAGQLLAGHAATVVEVKFSPDGLHLASSDEEGGVCLWQVASGALLQKWTAPDACQHLAFSPDGQWLASASKGIVLWRLATGELHQRLAWQGETILQLAFNAEGTQLMTLARNGELVRWDIGSGALLTRMAMSTLGRVYAAEIDIGTQKLFIQDFNSTSLLELQTAKLVWHKFKPNFGSVERLRFGLNGQQVASAVARNGLACLDAQTGEPMWQRWRILPHQHGTVVRFSPNSQYLVNSHPDQSALWLWNTQTGMPLGAVHIAGIRLLDAPLFDSESQQLGMATGSGLATYAVQSGQHSSVAASQGEVVFWQASSADQGYWASVDFPGRKADVLLFDGEAGKLRHTLKGHARRVNSIEFHPTQALLASASEDGTLCLWQAASGKQVQRINCQQGPLNCLAFSPAGQWLASIGEDGSLCLWPFKNGQVLEPAAWRIPAHKGQGSKVAFHPQGLHCATAGEDGAVRIWALDNAALVCTLPVPTWWRGSLRFSPNGQQLAYSGADGVTHIWDASNDAYPPQWLLYQDPDQTHLAAPGQSLTQHEAQARLPTIQAGGMAELASWYSVDFRHDPRGLWRGNGPALARLLYRETEPLQPAPWLPRDWCALELPELKAQD